MKPFTLLLALVALLMLNACGSEDFQGRYIASDGITSYEFLPNGKLIIVDGKQAISAYYNYDDKARSITLESDQTLPALNLAVNKDDSISFDDTTLIKGIDFQMLQDSTWIGHQGQYSFALTFSKTDQGMETFSELVSYYDDDMSYVYETDDSLTRLTGNKLLLDRTQYVVSDVTENSMTLSIGNNSMQLKKYPKGSKIEFRPDYQSVDDLPME